MTTKINEAKTFEEAITAIVEMVSSNAEEIASIDSKGVDKLFIADFRIHLECLFKCISIEIESIKNSLNEIRNIEGLTLFFSLIASGAMKTCNVITFKSVNLNRIGKRMISIYRKKNSDYGNSFDQSLDEDGLLVAKIRIGDKVRRFFSLTKDGTKEAQVKDESISDTLLDLANYCVMTIVYINNHVNKQHRYG